MISAIKKHISSLYVKNCIYITMCCLLLSVIFSTLSVAQEMNHRIISMKVVKAGKVALKKDAFQDLFNTIVQETPLLQSNPYYIGRPVILRVTFSCNVRPKKQYSVNIESEQIENKWGEWETNKAIIKEKLSYFCDQTREGKETKARQESARIKEETIKRRTLEEEAAKIAMAAFPNMAIIENDGRFIKFADETVFDTRTNLMWATKDNGSDIYWGDAKSYCENYHGGGYSDWRLPTVKELAGLYNKNIENTQYIKTNLIKLTSTEFWTSEVNWGKKPAKMAKKARKKSRRLSNIESETTSETLPAEYGYDVVKFSFKYGNQDWSKVFKSYCVDLRALPVRSINVGLTQESSAQSQ